MRKMAEELAKDGFDHVFELVKKAVQIALGIRRAGLTLILQEIPNHIGCISYFRLQYGRFEQDSLEDH